MRSKKKAIRSVEPKFAKVKTKTRPRISVSKGMIKDVVTVTQLADLDQVVIQAQSIDLFVKDPITHWVIVQDRSDLEHWHHHLDRFYTKHHLKLLPTLLPDSHYNRSNRHGYRRQQLLKLMASQLVSNERYMVLDSKNFFWRLQSLDDWRCLDGRPIITDMCATGPRQEWIDVVSAYLGLSRIEYTYEVLTPFVMTTQIAQKCCSFDMDFLFNEMSAPSGYWEAEQTFYSLIAHNYFGKLTPDDIENQPDLTRGDTYYITAADITTEQLNKWLSVATNLAAAVHRDVIRELSADQQIILVDWFVSLGFDATTVGRACSPCNLL